MTMPIDIWYRDVVNKKGDNKMNNNVTKNIPSVLYDVHNIINHVTRNVEVIAATIWGYEDTDPQPEAKMTCAIDDISKLAEKILYAGGLLEETLFRFAGKEVTVCENPLNSDSVEPKRNFLYLMDTAQEGLDRSISLAIRLHDGIFGSNGKPEEVVVDGSDDFAPVLVEVTALLEKSKILEKYTTDIYSAFAEPSVKSEPAIKFL